MRKFKFFNTFSDEEKWLIDMAKKGYELTNVFCCYNFKKSIPENSVIRIDFRTFKDKSSFIDYCTLFDDSGWKHICGTQYSGCQYFKKISDNTNEDIFSDKTSNAEKYKRLGNFWLTLSFPYACTLFIFATTGLININEMLNPKLLYYTPGLWEKTGFSFLSAFLFETPFALGRGFLWIVFPIMILIAIYFYWQSNKVYKELVK